MTINYSNKTPLTKKEEVKRDWLIFDAEGKTLGRLASEIAKVLRGKHKPNFTPHVDCGDGVIIVNAEKVKVSGNKAAQLLYRHHTGFRLSETPFRVMLQRKPSHILKHAVKGMLPKSTLGRHQLKRLKIFAGDRHKMEAQKPIKVNS